MDWSSRPWWVMGIVNITPDSFSDGGLSYRVDDALRHAEKLLAEGAHILDLGAESTRPGSSAISVDEELSRLMPVLTALKNITDCPISIDTSKSAVMQAVSSLGVNLINDVYALRHDGALSVMANSDVPVCLMHLQGEPHYFPENPHYDHLVMDVMSFFSERIQACELAGISKDRILLDPGFGFSKDLNQNIELFKQLPMIVQMGFPVVVGVSRKRMIGEILSKTRPQDRVTGSVSAAVEAIRLGASIVRVHDVAPTVEALQVASVLGAFDKKHRYDKQLQ